MKFCPNCGKELVENASYCVGCGLDITNFKNNNSKLKKSSSKETPYKQKTPKYVKIIVPILTLIFATFLIGSAISNSISQNEEFDEKKQILSQELNDVNIKMLELCTTTDNLGDLRGCKSESIPNIIEFCSDGYLDNLSVCSDVRLKEFSNTIDERLTVAEQKVEMLKNQILALEKQKEAILSETTTQIPLSNAQQSEYARIIRDCSRENEITAEEYLTKFANVDTLSEKQEESIQSNSERVSICSADIREIESNYCDSFNPSCTETGRFETYWEVMPRLQSAYEQICTNTGKFCGSNFLYP